MIDTYTNAAASPSALFDNVPTVQPVRELSRDYIDGVTAIWANGRTQRGRCRRDRVMTVEQARAALAHGMACVFVMAGDAEAVRADGALD